jgi:hypothetical protein
MPKGDDRNTRGRPARPARGRPGSKNYEPARAATGSFLKPTTPRAKIKGTKDFSYKGKRTGADKFVAGANILDAKGKVEKRQGFSDYLKGTGNRADDPRNWEFHYKEPKRKGTYTRGKNDQVRSYAGDARNKAKSAARRTGQSVYDVQKIEYETEGIKQDTRASGLKSKAMGGAGAFGSTRVASNVVAQRQKASRRTGRGSAARGPTRGAIA